MFWIHIWEKVLTCEISKDACATKNWKKMCTSCKSYFSWLVCDWQRMMWYGEGEVDLGHLACHSHTDTSLKKVSILTGWREVEANLRSNEVRCWGWGCDQLKTILCFPPALTPAHSPWKSWDCAAHMSRVRHSLYVNSFSSRILSCSVLCKKENWGSTEVNLLITPWFPILYPVHLWQGDELDNNSSYPSLVHLDKHPHLGDSRHPQSVEHVEPAGHLCLSIGEQTWRWKEQ